MKKHIANLVLLIIVISLASFISINVDKNKLIAQKWKVANIAFPAYEKALETATPEQRKDFDAKIEEMVKDAYFHFKKDSTYEINMAGNLEKGKWWLNKTQDKLLVQSILADGSQTAEQTIAIEELNKNKLILVNTFESGEVIKVVLSSN